MIQIKDRYAKAYKAIGMELDEALSNAFANLKKLDHQKWYTIQHDCNREGAMEYPYNQEISDYICDGIDESDVANFALQLYLPVARDNMYKRALTENMTDESYLDLLAKLDVDIQDVSLDEKKDRLYAYTDCPKCGTRRFFYSFDHGNRTIYAGCYDPHCVMGDVVDMISHIRTLRNTGYREAVALLYQLMQEVTGEVTGGNSSAKTIPALAFCAIKKGARYCFVVTDRSDLQMICQSMKDESVIFLEPYQTPNVSVIVESHVPSDQVVVILCDLSEQDRYENDIQRAGNGDRRIVVRGLPESRHTIKLLSLTVIHMLSEELQIG